ncbi:MAG: VWA domain-containing protein [bacterium]|nr:VWA domain-containing protein [bacterium]
MMMNVNIDRKFARAAGHDRRHVMVEMMAPEAPRGVARLPLNLALVIDRSGSMAGAKLGNAREAAVQVIRTLRASDRFAVVAYDDQVDVVWPSSLATPTAVERAIRRIQTIDARGSTDLHGGWLRGCEQVAEMLDGESLGKVLLLSDGLANHGCTDLATIARQVSDLCERGVRTSTFGVGADFDENLLQRMATAGGGQFYFIEQAAQVPDILQSELGEALQTVARDVELRVEVPMGVRAELLNDYPTRMEGTHLVVRVGELVSRQRLTLLMALDIPGGAEGSTVQVLLTATDRDGALGTPTAVVELRRVSEAEHEAQPRKAAVERAAASMQATRARREAIELNRAGAFHQARELLHATFEQLRRDANGDEEILGTAGGLEGDVDAFGVRMDAVSLKQAHFGTSSLLKGRKADGRAEREGR